MIFTTITGDDWRRAIARSRAEPNSISRQIAARINSGESQDGVTSASKPESETPDSHAETIVPKLAGS